MSFPQNQKKCQWGLKRIRDWFWFNFTDKISLFNQNPILVLVLNGQISLLIIPF